MPFRQIEWDNRLIDDCRQLIRLAVREDLDRTFDITSLSLVAAGDPARAALVAREAGTVAGLPIIELVMQEMNISCGKILHAHDGDSVPPGTTLATLEGQARDLLTAERTVLNFLGRLCGIATLTSQYVAAVAGTQARIYDTRKTTPGWRRLEKYAVGCGGGRNHRTGLYDAVLIKDNHLAQFSAIGGPAAAIEHARHFIRENCENRSFPVEVEVDNLEQFQSVLTANPDIILLDNMSHEQLKEAVRIRDAANSRAELEASGGITLATIGTVASTGVDRISVGALTHSARALDVGMDWGS